MLARTYMAVGSGTVQSVGMGASGSGSAVIGLACRIQNFPSLRAHSMS